MTRLFSYFRALPRFKKQVIAMVCDVGLAWLTLLLAFSLRLDQVLLPSGAVWWVYLASPLLAVPVFVSLGLYRAVIRYTGLSALQAIAKAAALYGVLFFCFVFFAQIDSVPRSVGILQPLLLLISVAVSRAWVRFWLNEDSRMGKHSSAERLIIYGAGSAGIQIAHALNHAKPYHVEGFVDDDLTLQGKTINGWKVYAPEALHDLASQGLVQSVLLAIPSIDRARRFEILEQLRQLRLHVRALPSLVDLANGTVQASGMQELDAEDLLGRTPIAPDLALMAKTITGKVVMVTGAAGSIGGELCRQILTLKPSQLLLVDHHEYGLYAIEQELAHKNTPHCQLIPLLANVRDAIKINYLFNTFKPQTVYHAAAYKHVPLVEQNIVEGLSTNVLGTLNTALAAKHAGTECFVLISTDKAVRPTNVMGATKRLAEMVLQALADACVLENATTIFTMVRFGNVLDSSGSVVPLFRQQIRAGGPVTLTHPEVTRYFMTIPEAAQLVIQAASMAKGGEVFVLDMGDPVRIADLAKRMIELSGFSLEDIEIEITGLRSGEKLYEELLIGDNPEPSTHPKILKANERFMPFMKLNTYIQTITNDIQINQVLSIRQTLFELVEGYSSDGKIVDWIHTHKSNL